MSHLVLRGIIDSHVHLREPGGEQKEDILSGTTAALAGGVIGVLDMPNTRPPTTDRRTFRQKEAILSRSAVSDYGLFLGLRAGITDDTLALAGHAVGLKLYLDQTYGDLLLQADTLHEVFERWPGPGPIAVHAESLTIGRCLEIARQTNQRLHVCHVPHPDDLLAIDRARQAGVRVTCEVTPHHLFLTEEAVARLGAFAQMKPPLLPAPLVERFWERLDLVDIVATDHAPHTREEKWGANPPPGVPGLETFLPLMLQAVDEGRLTRERLEALTYDNPIRIYGLRPPQDASVEVDLGTRRELPFEGYVTKCGWSPFAGLPALGRVERVTLRGKVVWEGGRLLARPGSGRSMVRVGGSEEDGRDMPPSGNREAQ
jgi:dihydroorotase